jgi:hypothetical protein
MTTEAEADWHARWKRHKSFTATELGKLHGEYRHALIAYWQKDGDERVSDKRLRELDEKARQTEKAFIDRLMELAGV